MVKKNREVITNHSKAQIEVAWHGRIQPVIFPLPQEAPYLPQSLVTSFMIDVDLTAAEIRVAELVEAAPVFVANMRQDTCMHAVNIQNCIFFYTKT